MPVVDRPAAPASRNIDIRVYGSGLALRLAGTTWICIRVLDSIFKQPGHKRRHCEPTGRANARPMTGSAKQSIGAAELKSGLLRRFAPRNDVKSRHSFAFPRRNAPGWCMYLSPNRGRGECRVPNAPAASRAKCKKHTSVVTTGPPDLPGIPARNGFNGLLRALPGDRACLSPSPALLLADLTPASRRQDHTTSPSAPAPFVKLCCRVHRILPRVDDVARRPSVGRTAGVLEVICPTRETEYFCKSDWTGQISLIRFNNFAF